MLSPAREATMARVKVRLRCCRCGRVRRFTAPAREVFALADELLRRPCPSTASGGPSRCGSRDLRLDVRAG
jgi:hypothetical protein